jgi:hypothetical protein
MAEIKSQIWTPMTKTLAFSSKLEKVPKKLKII